MGIGRHRKRESSRQRAKQIGREVHLPASSVIWEADAGAEGGGQGAYLKVMSVEHKRDWRWAVGPESLRPLPACLRPPAGGTGTRLPLGRVLHLAEIAILSKEDHDLCQNATEPEGSNLTLGS